MKLHPSLTTVTPISKFLAMLLFVLLPFVGFYLGMQYGKMSSTPTIYLNNAKQGLSFPTQTTSDDAGIRTACMGKDANNLDLVFSIQKRQGDFVKASVNYAHGGGGGYAFAVKQNSNWICPIQGNGIPDCVTVRKYHFPATLIKSCTQGNQIINLH